MFFVYRIGPRCSQETIHLEGLHPIEAFVELASVLGKERTTRGGLEVTTINRESKNSVVAEKLQPINFSERWKI